MSSASIDYRSDLSVDHDRAFTHWPSGSDDTAIARKLAAMARAADLDGADPIERLRAWSRAGDAFLSLGALADVRCLQCAAEAYSIAETLLKIVEVDAVERVQLHRAYGSTLLRLCDGCNVELAAAAATHLADALSLARSHIPEHVANIKLELCRAEHVIALRQGAKSVHTELDETLA